MIFGYTHQGSGLGDQLMRYITVRTLAESKGYEWGMYGWEHFKGDFFPNISVGSPVESNMEYAPFREKDVRENGVDIRSYDPEINFVTDWTQMDGSFEDDKYWRHNLANIAKWLAVEPVEVPDTTCFIGFRGGEYYADPNLGLPFEYYNEAIWNVMVKADPIKYQVHTDDPQLARNMFTNPMFEIVDNKPISHSKHTNMGFNWRSARCAKYAIIPNSAFFILPRILKHHEDPTAVTIAPRYWARRNTKGPWRPATYYPEFTYV